MILLNGLCFGFLARKYTATVFPHERIDRVVILHGVVSRATERIPADVHRFAIVVRCHSELMLPLVVVGGMRNGHSVDASFGHC